MADREAPAESAAPQVHRSAKEERRSEVLIVEDNASTMLLLRTLLEETRMVTTATNAADALEAARATRFDLLLLDINLGAGPSGIDVMRTLRREPSYEAVPMVAITAFGLPSDRDRFLKVGFDEYLSKPFDPDDLVAIIDGLLE